VVGVKIFVAEWLKLSLGKHFNFYLLGVVLLILAAGVTASLIAGHRGESRLPRNSPVMSDLREAGEGHVGRGRHPGRATVDEW
jgi:hypothetical protein